MDEPVRTGEVVEGWPVVSMPSHPGHVWIETWVDIRRVSDGVVRRYVTTSIYVSEDHGPHLYQWTEGNFGCDCNRSLFFARSVDEDEPDIDDVGHGDGVKFEIRLVNPLTDQPTYTEF